MRQLALSLKMFTKHFFNALSYHPDRLFPASPAARLFGLLHQPTLKILPPRHLALSLKMFTELFLTLCPDEKHHRTVLL